MYRAKHLEAQKNIMKYKNKNLKILIYAAEVIVSFMLGHYLYEFIFSISPTWANNFLTFLVVIVFTVSLFTWVNKKIGIE